MPPGGFEIDPRIGAAATRAPEASKVDYRPQAILKLHSPSSLDYRARHGLPVMRTLIRTPLITIILRIFC